MERLRNVVFEYNASLIAAAPSSSIPLTVKCTLQTYIDPMNGTMEELSP